MSEEKRPTVKFKPVQRKDGRWALEIWNADKNFSCGFVHWIEVTDGVIAKLSNPNFVMHPYYTLEEAESICSQLEEMYRKGEIS